MLRPAPSMLEGHTQPSVGSSLDWISVWEGMLNADTRLAPAAPAQLRNQLRHRQRVDCFYPRFKALFCAVLHRELPRQVILT